MRTLIYESPGQLAWHDVPDARIVNATDAVVEPIAVAMCDLDTYIVRGLTPFKPPFPLGHECVARVVAVGDDVRSVRPGDVVVVPFQISCGACPMCRSGYTAHCSTVPVRTAGYGFGAAGGDYGGVLADFVRVPFADAMLVAWPSEIPPVALASCCDNLADGWRTVAPYLAAQPGANVLIVGGMLPSVALYAAACAVALAAGSVDYVDHDPTRLDLAARIGANPINEIPQRAKPVYPITVDASGDVRGLRHAAMSTAPEGHLFVASIYFDDPTPLPLYAMYMRGAHVRTGRVHSRTVIPHILELMQSGRLQPDVVTTRVASWTDAPQAILEGTAAKLIVQR